MDTSTIIPLPTTCPAREVPAVLGIKDVLFAAAKTIAKTKSAIKGPTALSPWESELIKAGKLAKEGEFTPIEKLGSVKYSTLVDEAKKLTPTKGSLPTPAGEYSFGFSPASLDSFPTEETFKSGISLIQKNPYSASEWVGPPHVLTVYAPDGAVAGNLSWDSITGTIKMISVEPAHRKLGLARFMNQYAASITRLKHSRNRTPDGRGYSSAIGGIMPDKPFISPGKVSLMSVISEALGIKPKAKVKSPNADVPSYSAPTVGAPQSALDAELLAAQKARMAAESAAQYKRLTAWRNNPNRTYNEYPFVNGSLMESIDEADLLRLMKFGNDTPATWSWSNPLTAHLVPRPARPVAPEGAITGATGGYLKGGKFNIPKFDSGINSVPVDMLAMIHKNEAVVPADMNPFNPNANNATMGGATYNITNNINGYDGSLEQLSSMVTQKTITAIKGLDSRTASMSGPQMNVSIR